MNRLILGVMILASAACTGSITGQAGPENGAGSGSGSPRAGASGKGGPAAGAGNGATVEWFGTGDPKAAPRLPLRMLTRTEYDNTLALIFADTYGVAPASFKPGVGLPGETVDLSGFLSVGELSEQNILRQMEAASSLTATIGASLPKLVGCDLAKVADGEACLRAFLPGFAELLYRRPLESAELDSHLEFYRSLRTDLGDTAPAAATALIEAMLQSPHFLYRWEQGWRVAAREGSVARLNPYQVASRLSFFLWASGPDRELLTLARQGGLATPDAVAAQARKMLTSPRAAQALDSFHDQWLGVTGLDALFKDKNRFPEWSPALGLAMRQEIEAFARAVIIDGDGKLESLLSAPFSFVNAPLASVYGLAGITGQNLRRVDLDPKQRGGLLTMPGLAAVSSEASVPNPFRRGKLVLDKILCRTLEPPAVIPMPPAIDPKDPRSERQILEELTSQGACSGCHREINPFGFAMGSFDAIGKVRLKDEAGKAIDTAGKMPGGTQTFANAVELGAVLGRSDEVRACLTRQWVRFALARHEDDPDTESIIQAWKAFGTNGYNLRDLLTGFVGTRAFLYRTLEANEIVEVIQ